MAALSRRQFLAGSAATGGLLLFGRQALGATSAAAAPPTGQPIKIGILDPLSSPYKTSSIHDVHGATVAMELFNKRGGVLGRPVTLIEADDASNVETAVRMAN